jgi:hypothetical protein
VVFFAGLWELMGEGSGICCAIPPGPLAPAPSRDRQAFVAGAVNSGCAAGKGLGKLLR